MSIITQLSHVILVHKSAYTGQQGYWVEISHIS